MFVFLKGEGESIENQKKDPYTAQETWQAIGEKTQPQTIRQNTVPSIPERSNT